MRGGELSKWGNIKNALLEGLEDQYLKWSNIEEGNVEGGLNEMLISLKKEIEESLNKWDLS